MGDDIHHIESQNRGLQVQTANQKALLSELDRLIVCLV
jgi:exocyst complex component 1